MTSFQNWWEGKGLDILAYQWNPGASKMKGMVLSAEQPL